MRPNSRMLSYYIEVLERSLRCNSLTLGAVSTWGLAGTCPAQRQATICFQADPRDGNWNPNYNLFARFRKTQTSSCPSSYVQATETDAKLAREG